MKRAIQKTVVILLITLLIASFIAILPMLPAHSQPEEPRRFSISQGENTYTVEPIQGTVPADEFYDYYLSDPFYIAPIAYLLLAPNPVGVGQPIHVVAFLQPYPPDGRFFHGLTIDVVKPDGPPETIGPFNTDNNGAYYFDYTPTSVGTYTFQLSYPGEEYFDGGTVAYQACQSLIYPITVQSGPVPSPSPPEAPEGQSPRQFGSGHTPYMDPDGSAIYLYEDTNTGELSLIMHHGSEDPSSPVTEISFELSGVPNGAYIALSDDSPGEVSPELSLDTETGVAYGDWYKDWGESDGGVISGLTGGWQITIEAILYQAHLPYVWHYWDWSAESPIELDWNTAEAGPVIISAQVPEETGNLLVNPGFEDDLTGWGTTEVSAFYSVDSTTSHSGLYSCKGVEDNSESLGRLYQDVTGVTSPGNQYQISGWIKTSNVVGSVVIGLDYVDADGWTPEDGYVYEIGYVSETQDWAFFQSDWFILPPMPSDAQALWFLFDFNNGAGTAWFDDVSLKAVSGITVNNVVEGTPPDSPWNYIIIDDSTGNVVANFTLPAGGGSMSFTDPPFTNGGVFLITATSKRGYTTDISIQTDEGSSSEIDGLQAIIDLAPNGAAVVTFTNAPQSGAFAFAGLGESTPVDWFYIIPPRQPIPIQSACPIDINKDGKADLVLGKPMVMVVNLTGLPEASGQVSVRFDGGTIYTKDVTADNITSKCVISFPTIVPNTAGNNKQITGTYTLGGISGNLVTTTVSVKATKDLKLYFVWLDNLAYGHVDEATFYNNVRNITAFINATYPVKNVTVYATYAGKSVTGTSGPFSSLAKGKTAIETDCTSVKNALSKYSLTASATTIGIGICPNNTASGLPDYFAHKGTATSNYAGAVGFSKGPGTKGVVVLDGYYGGGAHEVGHTFKLYYGIPEQYTGQYSATGGMPSNGVWAEQSQWRTGISFMGLIEKGSFNTTWEDNVYTYLWLFRNLTVTAGDPEIVQTEGLINKDGTVEFTTNWYHTFGIPDAVDPGDYSLKFLDANNQMLSETSFDAQFFDNIDPGTSIGQDIIVDPKFGTIDSDTASFAFATLYPAGTASVQIVDNTGPEPHVMATVYAEDIINLQATKAYFTDSDFNPINSFDCLFTPSSHGYYKMTATNPATFYYNLQIRNTDPTGLFTITVKIPSDFDLKPLSPRANPVQIDGKPVAYSFSKTGMLTVSNIKINQNELVTLSVHLEYKLKGGSQLFPSSAQTTYSKAYDFTATLNSAQAPKASITAVGKKVTAIGGLIRDLLGEPKGGLTVTVTTKSGSVVGTDISPSDGFYFIAVPAGTYTVKISNSFGTLLTQASNVKVTQDQFAEKDFLLLLSTLDASIMGFVKDDFGNRVSGVTVKLLKSGTVLATTTTNLGGYYVFRFFLPGQYTVQITVPPGYTATTTSKTVWISLAETETVNFNLTPTGP